MKEFVTTLLVGLKCWLFHRRNHFDVGAEFQLCAICDASVLDAVINEYGPCREAK